METQSKILKWSLIIGMVIVLNLFFNYALSLVYKSPDYNTYFAQSQVIESIDTREDCLGIGGQWNANVATPPGTELAVGEKMAPQGYCDPNFTKQKDFDAAQKVYDRNVFITLVLLGAVCVAIGSFLAVNALISIALSMAGVLSFIIASMRYWGSADDLIKVIILGISLAILVWVAIKKFKD